MPEQAVKIKDDTQKKFWEFPKEMNEYFFKNTVTIKTFPKGYEAVNEEAYPDITIKNAKQFFSFLHREREFWLKQEIEDKAIFNNFLSKINDSYSYFNSAKKYYENKETYNAERSLASALNRLDSGIIYSRTKLCNFLLKYKNENNDFLNGIVYALTKQNSSYINIDSLKGILVGLEYCKVLKKAHDWSKQEISDFSETINTVNQNFKNLNQEYAEAFTEQHKLITEIQNKIDTQYKELTQNAETYFNTRDQRCKELENLYENKLRIEKPADYWKTMSREYSKQGKKWLITSCIIAAMIIGMLIAIIVLVPNVFSSNSHWFDIIKNSAIVTVIAGVAIYVLRITVKMAMSSFHLSRDAREREQLSYYYLALIKENAITDKERALIINSLFSRSDTGLLKGDASPTLTTNVAELVDKFTKNN